MTIPVGNLVKLFNSKLCDNSIDFKYEEGVHVCCDDKGFELIHPESKWCNWASGRDIRYYAEVSFPDDAKIEKIQHWEYKCDRIILGPLKNIWDHPNFNIMMYYYGDPELLSLIPEIQLPESVCTEIITKHPYYIRYIPSKLVTETQFLFALNKDIRCLNHIPIDRLTQDMANIAFEKDTDIIVNIPKHFRTKDMERKYNQYSKIRSCQGP